MIRYVDHTYRDFSRYIDDGGELTKHKKSDRNFPSKVHAMISDERHSDAITWMQPHGRAFKIIDKDILMSAVLPEYIVCKKYESFSRQLNAWGFKRLYRPGPDLGCYYHECFLRGLPKLTTLIMRMPPNQGKATPYPAGEPNFYDISERYPLPDSTPSRASGRAAAAASSSAAPSHATAQDEHQGSSSPSTRTSAGPSDQPNTAGASESGLPPSGHSRGPLAQKSEESSAGIGRLSAQHNPNFPSNMQHMPSFSNRNPPQGYSGSAGPAVPASMPPESYTHEYPRHHQPSGHTSFSHAPNPSTFYQTSDHSGHYSGSSYSQYPAQAPPPQYQYSAPYQQQYQPPSYYNDSTGYQSAPTGAQFPQSHPYPSSERNFSNFGHPSRGNPDAEPAAHPYSDSDANHHLNEWRPAHAAATTGSSRCGGQQQGSSITDPPAAPFKTERDAKEDNTQR